MNFEPELGVHYLASPGKSAKACRCIVLAMAELVINQNIVEALSTVNSRRVLLRPIQTRRELLAGS